MMSGFFKKSSGTTIKIIRTVLGFVISLFLVVSSSVVFAWFTISGTATVNNYDLALKSDSFELYVERTSYYDDANTYQGIDLFKNYLNSSGYSTTDVATGVSNEGVAVELVNELIDEEEGTRFLRPGSYGSLNLFLVTDQTDAVFSFSLNLVGYSKVYSETGTIESVQPYSGEDLAMLNNLMKGHFLFFKSRTGASVENYVYGDLITDGVYSFNTFSEETVTKRINGEDKNCYAITIYWAWPLTYEGMINNPKYPVNVETYARSHPEYFFEGTRDLNDLLSLTDGYNDGDQKIGEELDYISVYLTA